ncbi:386_t:CDS:2 [Diversispora eburnea]|uniref:386_t:CDS:1 n=1 Tax=Diversispora eburnea TaxID=1213867 RepID=A0A9N8V6M6_9GLOM|nr:386_t:CDS:2 [Diversispora eburnea]
MTAIQEKFRVNATPKISKLIINEKQKQQLTNLFKYKKVVAESWGETEEEQSKATDFLKYNGLIKIQKKNSRWKTRWSDKTNCATLYQCSCGSDMRVVRKTEGPNQRKLRQAYEFNGCLAFVKIEKYRKDKKDKKDKKDRKYKKNKKNDENVKNIENGENDEMDENNENNEENGSETNDKFKRVHGYLEHSEACHRAFPKKSTPKLHLNEDIRNITELLVRANNSIKDIISINQQFIKNHLKDAVLYFKPRTHQYDHVSLVLATREQILLAKLYGHQKSIILDGTFPTGNKKIQLYIIMVIDERGKGIPVGYLLFTRPGNPEVTGTSNQDYTILKKLLEEYKIQLTNDQQEPRVMFTPKVAIIDFDYVERTAVSEIWNRIHVFFLPHRVNLCWKTKANQLLGTGGDDNVMKLREDLRKELEDLFTWLQSASTEMEIRSKLQILENSVSNRYSREYEKKADSKILALFDGQREMIKFLQNEWVNGFMEMWTHYGRMAVESMGIDIKPLWNTKYLEGFNTQYNPSRMLRFQKKGHILRLDVLSFLLIKFITPVCNFQRHLWNETEKFIKNERPALDTVLEGEELESGQWRGLLAQYNNSIAFEQFDPRIQEVANYFITSRKISYIEYNGESLYVTVQSDIINAEIVRDEQDINYYVVGLLPTINCHCFHFLIKGGACAHILAAIHAVNWLRNQPDYPPDYRSFLEGEHQTIPEIRLPTKKDALEILKTQKERKTFYVEPNNNKSNKSNNNVEIEESDEDSGSEYDDYINSSFSELNINNNNNNNLENLVTERNYLNDENNINNNEISNNNDDEVRTWNEAFYVTTNRLKEKLCELSNISNELIQHKANIPLNVRSDLKDLDRELITNLQTMLNNENSRNIFTILDNIQQHIVTFSQPNNNNYPQNDDMDLTE